MGGIIVFRQARGNGWCCSSPVLLFLNTFFTETLVLVREHPFGTRNTGCGRVRRYADNGGYFLVRHALSGTQHKGNRIFLRYIVQGLPDMFTFGYLWNASA